MLAVLLTVYVDRFARAWHRLATTDTFGLHIHYMKRTPVRQAFLIYSFIRKSI